MADQAAPPVVAQAAGVQPTGQGSALPVENTGFWNLFPGVPDEHRTLLEPHLKNVQGHVTKLEQQFAPFKAFADSGVTPEAAAGLLRFSTDFDADPKGMWLKIGTMLQENGSIPNDLDLDYLGALANGEDPEAEVPVDPVVGQEENPLMELVQSLQAQVEELQGARQQEQTSRQERVQDQLLDKRMTSMREQLTKAGYPEEVLTEEALTASLIANRGNIEAATKQLIDTRSGILKGFTQTRTEENDDLDPLGGPPTTPRSQMKSRDKGDPWAKARSGATTQLRRENRATAQE